MASKPPRGTQARAKYTDAPRAAITDSMKMVRRPVRIVLDDAAAPGGPTVKVVPAVSECPAHPMIKRCRLYE